MVQILEPRPTNTIATTDAAGRPDRNPSSGRKLVLWTVLSAVLLAGSAGVRSVQSRYYQEENSYDVAAPFELKNIPKQVDDWQMLEGSEGSLDPLTTRITGSTDHILASYHNEQTGLMLQVMLLFGPAEPVLPHIPEVCYPSSGFKPAGPAIDRAIKIDDKMTTQFRATLFTKSNGRDLVRETAYYAFRHDGAWVPWVLTKNSPRKNPGIFKLQVSRRMTPTESRFQDEPIEDFVRKMVPALELMIARAAAEAPPAPKLATTAD